MLIVKRRTIAMYLSPMFALIALISLFPIVYTLYLSFTNISTFHLDDYHFIGLQNYQNILGSTNSDFYFVIGRTLLYVVVCIALFLIVGMGTALALNNPKIKLQPLWRGVLVLPWGMSPVITALIWKFLYHYDFGPINQILRVFFGHNVGVPWLTTAWGAFAAVVIVNLWMSYPFFTVVTLGALQSVPVELGEAARVDGANTWQRFWRVTLPLIRPAITPAAILSAVLTFQQFNLVWLITQGGPILSADQPGFTEFVIPYVYNRLLGAAGANVHFGLTAAFAITLFIILICFTLIGLRTTGIAKEAQA